ncbi:MAG: hypothetical protein WCL34_02915 [Methylococcaceae bacterium]
MKKLALLLAMSGVSFVANGAETLMIEATYQESITRSVGAATTPGESSTHYEANCKIYDNGKAIVNLNKYDYDDAANPMFNTKFKKNVKTIISTSATFKTDKAFLKETVDEAEAAGSEYPAYESSNHEFFVYKNKNKMKVYPSRMNGLKKLDLVLIAMCDQQGLKEAVLGCNIPGSCYFS